MLTAESLAVNTLARLRRAPGREGGSGFGNLVDRLHPSQREIFDSPARFRVAACGRRWGKTEDGTTEAIVAANQGQVVWWVAPSYPMAVDVWRNLKTLLNGQWEKQEQQHTVTSPKGGIIRVRSADNPDSLRGSGLDLAILDEAALMAKVVWLEVIRPALSDREGRALFLSTPKGLFNWFYELFEAGLDPNQPDWSCWNRPTWTNPLIKPEEIERARSSLPEDVFNQEYGAKFTSQAGLVCDNFDLNRNVAPVEVNPALSTVWAIDDGYAFGAGPGTNSYHPRVVLIAQETAQGGMNILAERYSTGESNYDATIDAALELGFPPPDVAYVDSSAAMLRGALTVRGIPNTGATHPVIEGIRNLRRMICDANNTTLLTVHPRCTQLIRELQTYRYDDTAQVSGDRKPMKMDDHGPDCLRYLTYHLRFGV